MEDAAASEQKQEADLEQENGEGDEQITTIKEGEKDELLSKNAQKKKLKQQRYEAKKAEKKAATKEHKKRELERKRREWDEKLLSMSQDEKSKLIHSRKQTRISRMEQRSIDRQNKLNRLTHAQKHSHNIVIDLDFAHLIVGHIAKKFFHVEQKVIVYESRLNLFPEKLKSRWMGPYTILRIFVHGAVEIECPKTKHVFKVNGQRVKPYLENFVASVDTLDLYDPPLLV